VSTANKIESDKQQMWLNNRIQMCK